MKNSRNEFGEFGNTKPLGRSLWRRLPYGKLFLLGLLLASLPFGIKGWNLLYVLLAESEPPSIQIMDSPSGIGRGENILKIQLKDEHSGIDKVVVRSEQGRNVQTIYEKVFSERKNEILIEVPIDSQKLNLKEGPLVVSILAFDKSFWSTSAKATAKFGVDFEAPKITVLTRQHNAARRGVELVFYTVDDSEEIFSGVLAGSSLFPGFPAKFLDSAFKDIANLYFAFFAIPSDFDSKSDKIRIFARDPVGNQALDSVYFRVKELNFGTETLAISEDLLETRVDEVYEDFLRVRAQVKGSAPVDFIPAVSESERLERLKLVAGEFPDLVSLVMKPLFARPKQSRYWDGKFKRVTVGRVAGKFGATRSYSYNGQVIFTRQADGTRYLVRDGAPVQASNSGIVIFADKLGHLGNTLILDHGFGLTTVYAHLGKIDRLEGDRVNVGEFIGSVSPSGLVNGPELDFQIRLHGQSVRPLEWWDGKWIRDHIENKISKIKKQYGLKSKSALN